MSENVQILKDYAEFVFNSFERATEGLAEKEIDWRPMEEFNNIRWILNHLSRICNLSLPRAIKGDSEYTPEGWPDDYREISHTLEKLMNDIATGKGVVLEGLEGLTSSDLDVDVVYWRGMRKRQLSLFAYLSEIVNHKGQIAMLRGSIKRRREKDEYFLV